MTPLSSLLSVWLPRGLIILLCLHFGRGVLPFSPVEGDEFGVVNGVQAWARGTDDFDAAAYSYPIQPGSYHLLRCLSRITGAPELAVFCATTALSVAGFIVLSSWLLAGLTGLRPAWVAVALLLTQELTAAACYANTNALAGVALMAGLVLAQRAGRHSTLWLAGLCIGLAGWLRMDSLLLSPVVLVLRLMQVRPGRAVGETAEVALASVLSLLVACAVTGLSLAASWNEFMGRDNFRHWQMLGVNGWLVLGYVATITSLIGTVGLCFNRRWHLLALVAVAGGCSLAVYGGSFVSPKYLYYAAPLLLLPALILLASWLRANDRPRRLLAYGLLALYFAEGLLGVQTASPFRRFIPRAPAIALGPLGLAGKSITVGLTEGEIIPTADGPRLRGGEFWAPGLWHREKTAMREELAHLDRILNEAPPEILLTSTYLSFSIADGWLRSHGYHLDPRQPFPGNPSSFSIEARSPGHRLRLILINHTPSDTREFSAATPPGRHILFVNDQGGVEFRHLAPAPDGWRLLSHGENHLITLYERSL